MKSMRLLPLFILFVLFPLTNFGQKENKQSSLGLYKGYSNQDYKGYSFTSQYVSMPDKVKLAVDVFLPKKREAEEKFPALVYFVRYGRSLEFKGLLRNRKKPLRGAHVPQKEVKFFTSNGYACVIVDLRGSGASFGFREMEFSDKEIKDMTNVLDWIISQPWSDKQTATTGVSYTGATSEFALTTKHPSLKACIPRSGIFDLYTDVISPGGIRHTEFIKSWKTTTNALDKNDFGVFGFMAKLVVKGVNPVTSDKKRLLLNQAITEHDKNFDIFKGLLEVESRDDKESVNKTSADDYSLHKKARLIVESKVPIYRISGWYDGANINSAIKGFLNTSNTEHLLIGPWDHGPHYQISPFNRNTKTKFSIFSEMLRFLDFHLKGVKNGINKQEKVQYFNLGHEQFRSSNSWPPSGKRLEFHFSSDQKLVKSPEKAKPGKVKYKCDYTISTATSSRWNSLTPLYKDGKTKYPDRRKVNEKMLLFRTVPIQDEMNVTGHPELDLTISIDATDASIFVYLEDVAPNGKTTYITEGQLRGAFRKLDDTTSAAYKFVGRQHSFLDKDKRAFIPGKKSRVRIRFLPISYTIPEGHRLQVSIANSDAAHFEIQKIRPTQMNIWTAPGMSRLILDIN